MKALFTMAAGLLVVACGNASKDESVGKEIADELNKSMDKAREVEEKIMQHKDDIDAAIRDAMDEAEDAVEEAEETIEDPLH